jgi:hypothetical protein
MGDGEDIDLKWQKWFAQLNAAQMKDYFKQFRPPDHEWREWSAIMSKHYLGQKGR